MHSEFPKAAEFSAFIASAQTRLGIDDTELARRCHMSISAIDRWKRGVSVPHPSSISSIEAVLS